MTYSEPRSICTFFQISAFLRLIRLSISPTFHSDLHYYLSSYHVTYLVGRSGFGTYLVASGCTYGLNTVFSTPSTFRSLSMPLRLDATYRLASWLLAPCQWSQQMILPTYRDCTLHVPRRSWKVAESNRLLT
jgi:hypothetical protein